MNFGPAPAYPRRSKKNRKQETYIRYAGLAFAGLLAFYWLVLSSWGPGALFRRPKKVTPGRAGRKPVLQKSLTGQELTVGYTSRLDEVELTVPIRSQTLEAPYVAADLKNRWFDFGGTAYVDTMKHVRLTQLRASQSGYLWSTLQLAPHGYQILVDFSVGGSKSHLHGDGMAMWLTERRSYAGPVFGAENNWRGVGIFFDTYANKRHAYGFPRISAVVNDGSLTYSNDDDGESIATAACSIDFRRDDVQTRIRLTYMRSQFLQLDMQHRSSNEWTTCFVIENLEIPFNPYLGFTAHTGEVVDNHDIIGISAYNVNHSTRKAQPFAQKPTKFRSYDVGVRERRPYRIVGRIFTGIKWLLVLAALGAAAYFGYTKYAARPSAKPPQLFL